MNSQHHAQRRTSKYKLACERLDDRTVPAVINPLFGAGGALVPLAAQTPGVSTSAINDVDHPQSPLPAPGGAHGVYFQPGGTGGMIFRSPFGLANPVQNPTPVTAAPTTLTGTNAINDIDHPQSPIPAPGGAHGVYFLPGGTGGVIFRGGSSLFSNRPTTPTATTPATATPTPTPTYTSGQQNAVFTNGRQSLFAQRTLQRFQAHHRPITGMNSAYARQQERLAQRLSNAALARAHHVQTTLPTRFMFHSRALRRGF
jgi:hypothetical protein